MKLIIIIIMLMITGCSKTVYYTNTDSELLYYKSLFYEECNKRQLKCEDVNLKFGDSADTNKGYCLIQKDAFNKTVKLININKSVFDFYNNTGQQHRIEMLVFHELGHCVLGLEHNNEFSIMSAGFYLDLENWLYYRQYLINEIFN